MALPAFADTRQPPVAHPSLALHLMTDSEFLLFLKQLDTATLQWQTQLKRVDVKSLDLDPRESGELLRSYSLCLRSLENTREEVQSLSQKQTLRSDLLLLVDLNDLTRNLDWLDRDIANAAGAKKASTTQKSLGYAREILEIETALAMHATAFQHHVFAYAKVIDATLDQTEKEPAALLPLE
jgi:hypothetical protein